MNNFFSRQAYVDAETNIASRDASNLKAKNPVIYLSMEEANEINHSQLFDTLVSRQEGWDSVDSLPLIDNGVHHIAIPYSYDTHHEVAFEGGTLEKVIEDYANSFLSGKKYILSCDHNVFFAISVEEFSYDHVDLGTEMGGYNSPFILFDETHSNWISFLNRFPFIIISSKNLEENFGLCGRPNQFWNEYLSSNIEDACKNFSSDFIDFINRTYIPRLKGCDVIPLRK